ncbi:hypothetical protein DMN91_012546 [Ooceraea biroi]|uniref:Mos1 transposase HTH domain-containing protein n=1 Tax=Ooceraea biroi TaxID=2015173 RepID=A0A3L8D4X7_OOCBI|nr:hypothetical protein DMN91_012546 [Ooceraea biroi]
MRRSIDDAIQTQAGGQATEYRTMEKSKIRVIYEYEFRRGTTVSETARNINAVFGEGSTTKATVGNWFKNFRDADFSLANEPRGRPKTKVDNDHLRAVVESDPSQSTRELASIFNVSIPTILVHLAAIGSETARNINAVFGEGSTTKATVGNWFKNFRDADFSLANEPRGRPKTKVDNDHLRAVVESDPSQSTRELASIFNVSIPTILVHLAAIAFRDFIDSRTPGFYSRGIDQLPLKWQKTMEKSKIRVIYEYEFRRGTTGSETARNINAVFGEGSTTKATVGNWFKNFRDADFSLANEPRGRPKTKHGKHGSLGKNYRFAT